MTIFLFIFGVLLTAIAIMIGSYKTYLPKDPNCPTDVKDAENNMLYMKIFRILGPALLLLGIIFLIFGIGVEF